MAGVCHLGFVWAYLAHPQKNFGCELVIDKSSFYNMKVAIFVAFDWKMPIHTFKNGIFGDLTP